MRKDTSSIPDFIIVGFMKSGTTTLLHHLRNHRKIHLPANEVPFFDREENFAKGFDWYQKKVLKNSPEEAMIFGEKTATYSHLDKVAKRIHENCPQTKIIWVLRNPVARTYSSYWHDYKQGMEILSFERAIRKEERRIEENSYYSHKNRSIYHLQIQRFLEYFPMEQMYFILFEDMIKPYNNDHVLNQLFHFLGTSNEYFEYSAEVKNKTVLPRYPITLYVGHKLGLINHPKVKNMLLSLNFKNKQPGYRKMSVETQKELKSYFHQHNKKLEHLINMDLSIWDQ